MVSRNAAIRVKELMAHDVISVHPDDPLSDAVSLMFENRVSAVPVIDKKQRCKGILSTTDLIALFLKGAIGQGEPEEWDTLAGDLAEVRQPDSRLGKRKVSEVMTRDVMTVTREDTIQTAAREMLRNRVHRLVVVDAQQRVLGILSTMDLLEAFSAES